MGLPIEPRAPLLVFVSTLFIYNLDHVIDTQVQRIPEEKAQAFFSRPGTLVLLVTAAIATGLLAGSAPLSAKVVFASYTVVGLLYGLPLFPWTRDGRAVRLRLKDVPHLKAWGVSAAITLGAVGLPLTWSGRALDGGVWAFALFVYVLVVTNAHMFDVRDIASDRANRMTTLPVAVGVRRAKLAVIAMNLVVLALMSWGWATELTRANPEIVLTIAAAVLYVLFIRVDTPRTYYGIVVDGCSYVPMVLVLGHKAFDALT